MRSILVLLLSFVSAAFSAPAPAASILIRGGTVVDGTGAARRIADVRVRGEVIEAIGHLSRLLGERVIDAQGLVVAPGFIDTHSHADGGLLQDPDAETQIRQGITTSVVGQDGDSHYPLRQFFSDLKAKRVALNIASFVGHGTVRSLVVGANYRRRTTPAEQRKMASIVEQEMTAGGLGLSSGLEYDPGFYSDTEELVACAKAAAQHGGIYISHVRDEGDRVFDAFHELIRIADEAHIPAQISHIKLDTSPVWGKAADVLRMIDDANRRGLDITADVYPYRYWQSTIIVLIPTRNWEDRSAWRKGLDEVGGASHVLLTTYTPDSAWAGKTIAQIAALTGKDDITVVQDIVRHTHGPEAAGHEGVVVTAMTESDLRQFIRAPRIMFCTDGSLRGSHPRGAGSFPRLLGRYVREAHLFTLEQAIHKMTGLPAWRMAFTHRGAVLTGFKADLVLFNPDTVVDTATTAHPRAEPVGIPYVMVNGSLVLDHGVITGSHPGEVLRRTRSHAAPLTLR